MQTGRIYEVSEVNEHIKALLDEDAALAGIFVRGELSNYKIYPSGHHYFTLKDPEGTLRSVMFKSAASKLRFRPENGMKVIAFGRITVFPRDGQYQLYCNELTPDGVGDLHVAFEQLKEKLFKEGLFDQQHKKPLPAYPERIALITSSAGAAVRDMIRVLGKRYPLAKVIVLPVRVQGEEAPPEICGALRYVNQWKLADLIITGRGGGSIEDLWAFNDERVARAIFASGIPVISAVGHEPDVTISDFVADLRAATPSNGAELAVPDMAELQIRLRNMETRAAQALDRKIKLGRERLERLRQTRSMLSPLNYIQDRRMVLDFDQERLANAMRNAVHGHREHYGRLAAALDALSPLKVLGRGYSIARGPAGEILKEYTQVHEGDTITVTLQRGRLGCTVTERKK
ncbi:exodeoxyribonuclease VII large subunit [Papillibacter cinnamivorans]|uniref:Exodeoxyribonuclease 7 large subunit n=1 Tax=Papillibacter cinnamivorans DSM 12816 TaxID=1122930 RepID=A0A1W2CJZ6_9FIRM|nr:exodeoxyribonuclease VII large subunit [Papillibacter cinnamivorans]SMC85511.1 Exodeoxyribonuclease VII large subunit [Papillibacter cinnamivorans DSM 12816]